MNDLFDLIHQRHSARVAYDPHRPIARSELDAILDAASWAPTAHNMQNFEMIVVDDPDLLRVVGAIKTKIDPVFLRENFAQLSFSFEELQQKRTGVVASMFPPAWRTPGGDFEAVAAALSPTPLSVSMQNCPCLVLVLYDTRKRAPASEGDVLGFISLGCVMENMWLAAHSFGIGAQILSVFSSPAVEKELRRLLDFPEHLRIAYAWRLGHPAATREYIRVRRDVRSFTHLNGYGTKY